MGLNERNAEFVRKLKQGIRVMEDATKAIFHSNSPFLRELRKAAVNLLSKEAK
jgi:hypothetical protein